MSVTTLLFTDLVGSTTLLSRIGESKMEAVRRAHFASLRAVIDNTHGHEVKNLGDGLMVAFANPSDAVACGAAMQRAVERQNQRGGQQLAIRVGIDLGETTEEDGDFFGGPVVIAKRLCDAAGSGQVLVSDLARAVAAPRSGYTFVDVGTFELKGVAEPVSCFTVDWERSDDPVFPLPSMVISLSEDRPPFVGRHQEWDALERAWHQACRGRWRLLLLAGESGIGKTRLACEFARAVGAGGARVLAGRSAEDLASPYQPFLEALRQYLGGLQAADEAQMGLSSAARALTRLVPEFQGWASGLPPFDREETETDRFRLFEEFSAFFTEIAAEAPVVLILDDLQWADQASLLLLKHLISGQRPASVLVIGTYRDSEVPRSHSLAHMLEDLHRDHLEQRLTLVGLPDVEATMLVDAFLGNGLPVDLVTTVVAATGGNPLFMEELMRDLRDSGRLRCIEPDDARAHGNCVPIDLEQWGVPVGVKDALWQRLRRLPEGTLNLLRTASVIGVEFDLGVLAELIGEPEDRVVALLDEAVRSSLLVEVPPQLGRYAFAHALVRHALYADHTLNGRAQLHARIADALERTHANGLQGGSATLVYHYSRAGPRCAPKLLTHALTAGEEAIDLLAYEDAEIQFSTALRALDDSRLQGESERARALIGLAAARRAEGDPAESRAACLEAAKLAQSVGDHELLARAAMGLALPGAAIGMDFGVVDDERVTLLEDALAMMPSTASELRLRSLVHLVLALHLSPLTERRNAAAAEAVTIASTLGRPELRAAALAARHSTEWGCTPIQQRLATARAMAALAHEGGAMLTALEGHIALALDLLEAGEIDEMRLQSGIIYDAAAELRQPFYQWYSHTLDATYASLQGRYADGETCISRAVECSSDALGRRPAWGRIGWGYVTGWDLGTLGEVEGPLGQLHHLFPGSLVLDAALANLACELGHVDEAGAIVTDVLTHPELIPQDAMWLFTLALLAEVTWWLRDVEGAERLEALLAPAAGRLVVVGSGVGCFGAVDRSRGLLALVRGEYEVAVTRLRRALELHERIGARPWISRTDGLLARALVGRDGPGDAEEAERRLTEGRSLAEQLEARGVCASLDRIVNHS